MVNSTVNKKSFLTIVIVLKTIFIFAQSEIELNEQIFNGEYIKASKTVNTLIEKYPANAKYYYKAAKIYTYLNKIKVAESYLKKTIKLDSTNPIYNIAYAENLFANGRKNNAILQLETILKKDSFNYLALNKLVKYYVKEKKYRKAKNIYDKLIIGDSLNTYYYRKTAFCLLKLNNKVNAEKYYIKAYEIDSSEITNIKKLSNFYLKIANYNKAITVANRGVKIDSANSFFHKVKAMSYYHKNHNYRAVPEFLKVIELGDSSLQLSKLLGYALYKTFNFEDAYGCLHNVYNVDSLDFKVTMFLGRICYELHKDKECLFFLNKTLELLEPPKRVIYNVHDIKSKVFFSQTKYKKALSEEDLKYKISKRRNFRDFYYIGLIYDKMNERKKALFNYEKYISGAKKVELDKEKNKQYEFVLQRVSRIKEYMHFREE